MPGMPAWHAGSNRQDLRMVWFLKYQLTNRIVWSPQKITIDEKGRCHHHPQPPQAWN
jgi:hypothetical protein